MSRVAIMGSGSWGTAFSMVLADAGSQVTIWTRDEEVANQGGKKRNIIFKMTGNESLSNAQESTSSVGKFTEVLSALASQAEKTFQHGKLQVQQTIASTFGSSPVYPPPPNLVPPFDIQAANTLNEIAILDAVEEWTVYNMNHLSHVFHIHVNPMYIIKVNGKPPH